jgi:flavorubredoxin
MPVLEDLKGLRFKNKIGAAFGSYGWSGQSPAIIEKHLNESKIQVVAESVKAKWQPTGDDLAACKSLGAKVGDAILKG